MAILIKRYSNRKLYNTDTSRYITLKGVGELLDRGEEVRVVDNETGEDITQVALSQILVDNKRAREIPSDTLLTQILSRGGDAVYTAIRKSVDDASGGLGEFQEKFRQFVARGDAAMGRSRGFAWERRARETDERETSEREPLRDETARSVAGGPGRRAAHPDEAAPHAQDVPSDLGGLIREAVGRAFRTSEWPSRAELERLNRNLERVAAALERLEIVLEKTPPPRPRP